MHEATDVSGDKPLITVFDCGLVVSGAGYDCRGIR